MNGLYLIITNPIIGYAELTRIAVSCEVPIIQLRIKDSNSNKLKIAKEIRNITNNSKTLFIINDDIQLAIESNSDGVHLGQNDTPVIEAKKIWNNPQKLFGVSTHNLEQAKQAVKKGADYIGIGPIYATNSKQQLDPILGIKSAKKINDECECTSFAIGGINQKNLKNVKKIGTSGFCVLSAINDSKNPEKIIRSFKENW
tara:strand:+ start:4268 stop:4867 length:600 start_codon:yes stop_codon:yes gene_type:complete